MSRNKRDDNFPDNGFEAWGGYMQAKIAKLENQFTSVTAKEEILSNIFTGINIFVNGFTIPSADELKCLMSKHGGVYHTYQRNEDFIIATNLPDTKVKNMSLARVVKPEWITDSIKAKKLLDYRNYLLFGHSRTQRVLNFTKRVTNDKDIDETKYSSLKETLIENKDTIVNNDYFNSINLKKSTINTTKQMCQNSINGTGNEINPEKLQVTKTAADPNFISEFYNNSRLHHISQLGACFKQYVNDLREQSNFVFPARHNLKDIIKSSNNRLSQLVFEKGKTIMHIDMDCFFVSVGLRNRPELRGKPVAVTHSKGGIPHIKRSGVDRNAEFNLYKQKQAKKLVKDTGLQGQELEIETRVDNIGDEESKFGSMSEIASCSYEARARGVGNGMFMGVALRLCPDLQTIPYDFEGYKEVAYTLYNTVAQYTLDIEAVSCDEMYVDCTELLKDMNMNVQDFATILREEIKTKTGCPCSTGFGGNRLQARLATKKAKPDGQFFLTADLVQDFMYEINLKDLPGVGRQISQKLELLGHTTCGTLQSLSLATLKCHLGTKTGAQLFDQCRGRDQNALAFHTVRKSVSAEVNYGIRFENNDQAIEFLKQLSAEVHSRMQQFKVLGKCITLKLMVRAEEAPVETAKFMGHGYCNVINKSNNLPAATNDVEVLTQETIEIFKKINVDAKEMRGVGIQVTKLVPIIKQQSKGAISKFLCNKPTIINIKRETKTEVVSNKINLENNENKQLQLKNSRLKKKSPTTDKTKSPPGKRRGRPPKALTLEQKEKKRAISKSGVEARDTPFKNPMMKPQNSLKETKIKVEKTEGLLGLPWNKARELLRAWLDSGQKPLSCDIRMIAEYMREMVIKKEIDKVEILINFLSRRTEEIGSQVWLDVYCHVVEQVQNTMIAIYGKRLHIDAT